MAKYEVQKGRTILTMRGTAHEGAKIELKNFSGDDDNEKQIKIDNLVKLGFLEEVPLTDEEKAALAEVEEIREKAKEEVEKRRLAALAKAEDKLKKQNEAKLKKESAILQADFDKMNKDPMIRFAEDWEIELKGTRADEIRTELKDIQESLTDPR